MNQEQTAHTFSRVVAVTAALFLAGLLSLSIATKPAHAQNAGTVGILSKLVPVFSGQTSTACSSIFPDIGQGSNILFVSQTSAGGGNAVFDLEWSPTGLAPFYPIVQALYVDTFATTHTLTTNGYFPNLRACVTRTSGTYSAWYTTTSGPLSFSAAGVGSFGPTSPPVCDQTSTALVPSTVTGFIGPQPKSSANDVVVICSMTISFNGAPAAGSLAFDWAGASDCTGETSAYLNYTSTATPQTFTIPTILHSYFAVGITRNFLCVTNTAGVDASLVVNWASIHSL